MSIVNVIIRATASPSPGVTGYNYRAIDHTGKVHSYPTVFRPDGFDAEAYKATVAANIEMNLAQKEIDELLED